MRAARETAPAGGTGAQMVIHFRPMGETRARRVAVAWLDGGFVSWSSPCLDEAHEHGDPDAFEHCFGDCACAFPAFMRAMNWLDAVCFAATGLEDVIAACRAFPEYGLMCVLAAQHAELADALAAT